MSTSILKTKFYIPKQRDRAVLRPHLISKLDNGLQGKLTLISAPAGFGKTTLANEWLASCKQQAAWLSLDEADNDLNRFLSHMICALQTIAESFGEAVLNALQSPQPPPHDSVLTAMLNEISSMPNQILLVLDDYHLVDATSVDEALSFLLEHLPPQLHLVITTREDPNIPLAKLRVRGQLSELRATDLRFTADEAAQFLNQIMGLTLSPENIATLETRTEGWVAGLQLAAISMQGSQDATQFIKSFTGSHRFVIDYLIEEVLHQQHQNIQNFLLGTSILDRLCGSLCDAVLQDPTTPGQVTLEYLERVNLLLVPLDDKREWYRYHHLFSDVLQARAMEKSSEHIPLFHQRASEWYEQNNLPFDAVRHALAAKNYNRAANLMELAWPDLFGRYYQNHIMYNWVKEIPEELLQVRPVLSVGYAWALLDFGELEAAEVQLNNAEKCLEADSNTSSNTTSSNIIFADEKEFRNLPAKIAAARAYHAQALGDVNKTVIQARRALELLSEKEHQWRAIGAALLAMAYWPRGDLESAYNSFADCMAEMQLTGNISYAISGTFVMIDIRMAQEPLPQGTADMYLGLSLIHYEQGDLESASQYLLKSEALGEQLALPD